MSSNADYARYLVQRADDAIGDYLVPDSAKAATAAVLRQLAYHPRPTGVWLEEIADEIEGNGEDR